MQNKFNILLSLLLVVICIFLFSACQQNKIKKNSSKRALYFWKSVYNPSDYENERLKELNVNELYVKYFDIEWNKEYKLPMPIAQVNFKDSFQIKKYAIKPTVFISNQCIFNIELMQVDSLASNILNLIYKINAINNLPNPSEIQIDCDWTATTQDRYFALLAAIKKREKNAAISATIRLHQIKYKEKTGVPPVDKGLLMCYNMGNLKNSQTKNSIIEFEEFNKYTQELHSYPLPLDIGLPIFEWNIFIRNNSFIGIINSFPDSIFANKMLFSKKDNRYTILKDSLLLGYDFRKGDILRNEKSEFNVILAVAKKLQQQLKLTPSTIVLYHLDSLTFIKYTNHELETIYSSFP